MYRLCAIDLDDTLLGPDHAISARNARAVRATVQQGVTVVLASGRMHAATLRYAGELELSTPIISYNGAMVKNPQTGEELLHETISPDMAAVVIDYCARRGLQLNFYYQDTLYSAAYTDWLKLYYGRTGSPIRIDADLYSHFRDTAPTKLIIVDSPEITDRLLGYFRDLFQDQLYVTKSNVEYLEFMPPNANKGAALSVVADRYGVAAAECVAFGDSWNDIPMLEWAGLGIAVSNAKPQVIQAADRVVLANAEDGVGVALESLFALGEPS